MKILNNYEFISENGYKKEKKTMSNTLYLVTGAAGFIGSNLCKALLKDEDIKLIVGIDNMNDYYDVNLKEYRLKELVSYNNFKFVKGDITDRELIFDLFENEKFDIVVNFAAESHVDRSILHPEIFVETNVIDE